ncbi:MAG: 4'-phosphopantetheinyl transferase superfamily protein [Xanthomonadales bacterium]|nr:4'-phosphopantetheinyl transferase superfamily protein [Xanthomonadales bacterium]
MDQVRFQDRALPLKALEAPGGGLVHAWFLDLSELASPVSDATHSGPRQERATRRFYLRLLLGAYLGLPGKAVRINRMRRGKPVLDRTHHADRLEFSMAASRGYCLIGITMQNPIGVDLEPAGRQARQPRALAHRYFSADEQKALSAVEDRDLARAFMHTWACKEAVVKAAGHGIANQLCRFTVCTDPREAPRIKSIDGDDPARWSLRMLNPTEGLLGAVAVRHPEMRIEGFRLRPVEGAR